VSVCIAAICRGKKIIAVTDRKVSSVEFSNEDAAIKILHVNHNWFAMFAGNDITPAVPIVDDVHEWLATKPNTLANARDAFEQCYQRYLSKLAAAKYLGRWQLSMQQFIDIGREKFGDDVFDNLCSQIEQVKLQFQFLVGGFDEDQYAHLFVVRNPGISDVKDLPGYWAIGDGDFAAMSTLGYFKQSVIADWANTTYNVWAAKFMAEKATSTVGELSFNILYGPNGEESFPETEPIARRAWRKDGRPSVPKGVIQMIEAQARRDRPKRSTPRKSEPGQ